MKKITTQLFEEKNVHFIDSIVITKYYKFFHDHSFYACGCMLCLGWICYAEKTHGEFILPYISTTRSPQQMMGSLVKGYFAEQQV